MKEILQMSYKILQDVQQDLAQQPSSCCMQESGINLARPNDLSRLFVEKSAKIAKRGQITCKIARLVQFLQNDLQELQIILQIICYKSCKICSKILQDLSTRRDVSTISLIKNEVEYYSNKSTLNILRD